MTQEIPQWAVDERRRKLRREHGWEQAFLRWLRSNYPEPSADLEWRAYYQLRCHWKRPQIRGFIEAYDTDDLPGILDTAGCLSLTEFLHFVGVLAHGEYARTLPRKAMLALLAGEDAVRGAVIVEAASSGGLAKARGQTTTPPATVKWLPNIGGAKRRPGESLHQRSRRRSGRRRSMAAYPEAPPSQPSIAS
jgi:hypothetical protein